jgi:alanine racemase
MADAVTVPASALRLEIDAATLAANWRALDRLSGRARAGAAVKADGYGLGAARVATILWYAGCRDFFVAHWGEAAALLGHVPAERLAVLHGPMTAADAAFAVATGIRPVINSVAQARIWRDAGGGLCDLMVDTGINRLGVPPGDLDDPAIGALTVAVLHSHLASADEDSALNLAQLARWRAACGQVRHESAAIANSAGIVLGADWHGDLTRPGLALYGGIPRTELAGSIGQVARPMAAVIQQRDLVAGDTVGYNATFVAPGPMRVGVIALGYADGYLRCWSGRGAMLHHGERLPVLGRVSMDMTVIDLTNAPQCGEGDWVEAEYDLHAASAISGLSQYELLTSLGRRFSRG